MEFLLHFGFYLLALATVPGGVPVPPLTQVEQPAAPNEPQAKADTGSAPAPTLDEIYLQVFKRKAPPVQDFDYPVLLDGMPQGAFRIAPDPAGGDGGQVSAEIIGRSLVPVASPALTSRLIALPHDRTMISFEDLRGLGYQVRFDQARLLLVIDSAFDMRGVRRLSIRPSGAPKGVTLTRQADVSAYASLRTGVTMVAATTRGDTGIEGVVGELDLGLNLFGVAAEGRLRYDDSATDKLGRGDVRLTYDSRNQSVRYELGDLSIGRRSFQDTPRIMGLGAFRYYSINPYRNIRPSTSYGFELTEPAEVEVALNGIKVRSFDLQAGNYDLRDLPLVSSANNDVQLTIQYPSGRVETLNFPAFFDLDLLAPGLSEFAVNLGIPYRDERNRRIYDSSTFSGMAFIRHGFSNTLTAGLNWEGDRHFSLVGGEVIWASPVGTFGINAAVDVTRMRTSTGRVNLQYRWRDTEAQRGWTLDGLLTLTGAEYRTLNRQGFDSAIASQGRLRVGRALGPQMTVQAYAGFENYRADVPHGRYIGANLSRNFGPVSISAEGEFSRRGQASEFTARLGISMPLGRGSFSGSATSEGKAVRLQYDHPPPQGAGQFGFGAGFERRDGGDRQYLRGSYFGNRFEASLQQTSQDYLQSGDTGDLRYDLRMGTALVMADGHFAVSRPVGNSFAIVGRNRLAADYDLAVEPLTGFATSERRYSAYTDALGSAVVTGLTPYFNRTLQVDAPHAPAGTSVGGQVFVLNPGYRSGTYLEVGGAGNVTAIGNLVDRDGDPIGLAMLKLREICPDKCPEQPAVDVFTNASGRFFVDQLKAGSRYQLELESDGQITLQRFEIPQETVGIYRFATPISLDVDAPSRK